MTQKVWFITGAGRGMVNVEGEPRVGVQLAPDHVPPDWPDGTLPQQIHLDLWVEDFPSAHDQSWRSVHGAEARRTRDIRQLPGLRGSSRTSVPPVLDRAVAS